MKITFVGAAHEVTGSCPLQDLGGARDRLARPSAHGVGL